MAAMLVMLCETVRRERDRGVAANASDYTLQ
jgi:hypothetical protein